MTNRIGIKKGQSHGCYACFMKKLGIIFLLQWLRIKKKLKANDYVYDWHIESQICELRDFQWRFRETSNYPKRDFGIYSIKLKFAVKSNESPNAKMQ